tara:strand:- start:938 stop:1612 length:675 start_codon:yes stop_codon:yes gene_type:complete
MKPFKLVSLLLFTILVLSCSSTKNASDGSGETVLPDFSKIDSYEQLLTRAKAMDTTLSFYELRMAYTKTDDYAPYGADGSDEFKEAMENLESGNLAEAEKLIYKALEYEYLSPRKHMIAAAIQRELGNEDKYEYHVYFYLNALASIALSGEGKTPATAMVVISVAEEYDYLGFMGYDFMGQALLDSDYGAVDQISVTDKESKESLDLYFNVSIPMGHLQNSLSK